MMAERHTYDPNEEFFIPSPGTMYEILHSPDMASLNYAVTPPGKIPSSSSNSNSPQEFRPEFENFLLSGFETETHNNSFVLLGSHIDPIFDPPSSSSSETLSSEYQMEGLQIIAEPKRYYRARYPCEIDQMKCRAKRFIRAQNDDKKHEYPTVKIPPSWCQPNRQLYIRVTLVTVISEHIPFHCIHPYEIDTSENDIIKDTENNSIYFRINENEFQTSEKSFRIIVKKKKQDELNKYGSIRPFDDLNQNQNKILQNPTDAKQKIVLYQLPQSQFVFTFAERCNNNYFPSPMLDASIVSQIMIDTAAEGRHSLATYLNNTNANKVKCIPQKGDWYGDEEVLLVMSSIVKRKTYKITFDFGQYGQQIINDTHCVDTKTISFRTPMCPILVGDEDLKVLFQIHENNILIQQIEFVYLTTNRVTRNVCPSCQRTAAAFNVGHKRRRECAGVYEDDAIVPLASQMNQLSIEPTTAEAPRSRQSSLNSTDDTASKFDSYLIKLKDALSVFVRTNDPSQLFRRTRVLFAKYYDYPPPLNVAIESGHLHIASSLIEQVIDLLAPNGLLERVNDNGETPLLIAAKYNHLKIIEMILKKRPEFAEQKDKDENNIFHLLANLNDEKVAETIEKILAILTDKSKIDLLKEKNQKKQTPIDIAQSYDNLKLIELFKSSANDVKQND